MGDWKLIAGDDHDELYNLATDPGERNDRAAAEPDRVRAIRTKLATLLADAKPARTESPADRPGRRRRPAAATAP